MQIKIRRPFDGKFPITFRFREAPEWFVKKIGYPHNGVDYALPAGTKVVACDDGVVKQIDLHPRGWGHFVRVRHSWGMSHYAHLSSISVQLGQEVKKGQQLALSGQSGFSTGPHLHFGIKVDGVLDLEMKNWLDPEEYVNREVEPQTTTCPNCGFTFPKGMEV